MYQYYTTIPNNWLMYLTSWGSVFTRRLQRSSGRIIMYCHYAGAIMGGTAYSKAWLCCRRISRRASGYWEGWFFHRLHRWGFAISPQTPLF